MAVRHGATAHPQGGVRHGDLEYAPLADTPANLSAAYPLDFAVEQASVRFTSDKAGETARVLVTDSIQQPSAEQIAAGQDHTGSAAEAADSLTSVVGENEFSALAIGAGYWYAHIVQGESNVVSTVQFRVAGDNDGPDEWFWPAITTPAPDSVLPPGAQAGQPGWISRVSGGPIDVLSNGSTSSESAEWATEAQIWDQSLNGGLGGLSEVYSVAYALPVGGEASVEAIGSVTASGQKRAQGNAQAGSGGAVAAQGSKTALGTATVSAIAGASAQGAIAGTEGDGTASVEAVGSVAASGRKNAQGTARAESVAEASASGVLDGEGAGQATVVSIASVSASGRKWTSGTAAASSIASVTVSGVSGQPGSLAWEVTVEASRDSQHLGTYTAGDDIKITLPLGENIAGLQSAKFTLARRGEGLIEKGLGEGVLVVDANDGVLSIVIGADDTEGLSGLLGWEVEVVDVFGNHRTPAFGLIYLRQAIIANAI